LTSVNQNYPNTSKNNLKQKKKKTGSGVFISVFQLYLLKNSSLWCVYFGVSTISFKKFKNLKDIVETL
jgi:hypothetical protein